MIRGPLCIFYLDVHMERLLLPWCPLWASCMLAFSSAAVGDRTPKISESCYRCPQRMPGLLFVSVGSLTHSGCVLKTCFHCYMFSEDMQRCLMILFQPHMWCGARQIWGLLNIYRWTSMLWSSVNSVTFDLFFRVFFSVYFIFIHTLYIGACAGVVLVSVDN